MQASFFEVGKAYQHTQWKPSRFFTVKYVGGDFIVVAINREGGEREEVFYPSAWDESMIRDYAPVVPLKYRPVYRDGTYGSRWNTRDQALSEIAIAPAALIVNYSDGHWELEQLS